MAKKSAVKQALGKIKTPAAKPVTILGKAATKPKGR
jgi:hypothetical protein